MEDDFKIKRCRSCGSERLNPIISLGNQYVTNFISSEEEHNSIPRVPLNLVLCEECKLLQLEHNAPPESMWGGQYWYKSAINRLIREDLQDIVEKSKGLVNLERGDIVIDIGCNDGTLMGFYDKDLGLEVAGFEPSINVAEEAERKGFKVINDFFNYGSFIHNFGVKKAKVITAISMFYDLEDPNIFLRDIVSALDKDGLFVIQQNYLVKMLENNAFDNICHEHREYYSLTSLKHLLDRHGLEIFDVEENGINGGSIRTYIKLRDNESLGTQESANRVRLVLEKEKNSGLDTKIPYEEFADRIVNIKKELIDFLIEEKRAGKRICGLGASTRGNTTLQYFELGPDLIDCIFDRNSDKWGKKTVGTLIPIESPDKIGGFNPDYQLVLIWHIFKGIGDDEKEFIKKGGKFILPLPSYRVVDQV